MIFGIEDNSDLFGLLGNLNSKFDFKSEVLNEFLLSRENLVLFLQRLSDNGMLKNQTICHYSQVKDSNIFEYYFYIVDYKVFGTPYFIQLLSENFVFSKEFKVKEVKISFKVDSIFNFNKYIGKWNDFEMKFLNRFFRDSVNF